MYEIKWYFEIEYKTHYRDLHGQISFFYYNYYKRTNLLIKQVLQTAASGCYN